VKSIAPVSLLLLVVAPAVVACDRGPASAQATAVTGAPSAVAESASILADADIAEATRRHMDEDGVLRTQHVKVVVTQGIAALSGTVADLLAKKRATAVAETIRGVRAVVDEVIVAPSTRTFSPEPHGSSTS
jgi:osmotically-inducible protein OsmY